MGMSADLEVAIAEGSTLVRVGTALFGTRARGVAP
jgi:PLP dependent protein